VQDALNNSRTNVSTVVVSPPSNETSPAASNATDGAAPPANETSSQPPADPNATTNSSSSSSNASFPLPQPWVGQLANASGNGSINATAEAGSNATDALSEYITLRNNKGMTVVVLPLGAIIQRLIVPDK
jgi:hypothetical protein